MNLYIRDCDTEVYSSQLQRYIKQLRLARLLERVPLSEIFSDDSQSRVSYEQFAEDTPSWDQVMHSIVEEMHYI